MKGKVQVTAISINQMPATGLPGAEQPASRSFNVVAVPVVEDGSLFSANPIPLTFPLSDISDLQVGGFYDLSLVASKA